MAEEWRDNSSQKRTRLPLALADRMRAAQDIAALFSAEARVRRLARWHVFVLSLCVLVVASYFALAMLHYYAPNASIFSGAYAPRFAIAVMGELWLWFAQVGVFLLLFDSRARDHVEGVDELLNVRPIRPGARLIAALLAVTVLTWTVLVVVLLLLQGFAFVSTLLSNHGATAAIWWFAVPLEGFSVAGFLLFDAMPRLFFVGALSQFIGVVIRQRFLAIGCFVLLYCLYVYWIGTQPLGLSDVFAAVSRYGTSDIVFDFVGRDGLMKAVAHLTMGAALCAAAIVVSNGLSKSRLHAVVGLVFGVISCSIFAGLINKVQESSRLREQWRAALHEAASRANPDLEHVAGTITVEPGERMVVDVELEVTTPSRRSPVVFALNPGLVVQEIRVDGRAVAFRRVNGLVELEAQDSKLMKVELRAAGIPDERYGYLDDALEWRSGTRSSPLVFLGTKAAIYDAEYVALMPAVAWLPTAPRSLAGHGTDFFNMDVVVEVPHDWAVVATGDREVLAGSGRYRFVSANPVSRAALFAGPLVRNAIVVGGVEFELYMSERHVREADFFESSVGVEGGVADYATEMLGRAEELGLPYPYRQLSFVEIPAELRTYGGGWRMDTEMAQPGIMLIHEYSFPTRRFRRPRDLLNGSLEDGRARAHMLRSTFTFNLQGGNYQQLARNLLLFQTSSDGIGAAAVNQMCLELTIDLMWPGRRILDGKEVSWGEFSAHQYASSEFGISIGPFFRNLKRGQMPNRVDVIDDSVRTWERISDTALVDTQGVDMLLLRTPRVREAIFAHLGFREVANVLAELRRRYSGRTFGVEEFTSAFEGAGMPKGFLDDWLYETQLPGFLFSEAYVREVDGRGGKGFHLSVHVRNDEDVTGAFRLVYEQRVDGVDLHWRDSNVVFVGPHAAVEVGLLMPEPPREIWLDSFLSLNRRPVRLSIGRSETEESEDGILVGSRESFWRPKETEAIFVDDRDDGFYVNGGAGGKLPWYRNEPFFVGWAREEQTTAWGRYFRTVARTTGVDVAEFVAELPRGRWTLDYHLPDIGVKTWGYTRRSRVDKHGLYLFRVKAGDLAEEFAVGSEEVVGGWNRIGSFEFTGGKVSVAVSNGAADGESTIYADAIRWSRLPGSR